MARRRSSRPAIRSGSRTLLRLPAPSDRAAFGSLRAASARFLRPWEPRPAADAPDPFDQLLASRKDPRCARLLLCRAEDGTLLGGVNANEIVGGIFQSAYLGYWIGAPHAGQGYMTEGFALMLEHVFLDLGLHRVEANVQPTNAASLALVRRASFTREGYSPRYLKIAGRWSDHERWALLVDDWRRARRARRTRS
ncbi:MAG: GNAT family protein [Acidobacteriota bacterium]